MQAPLGAIVLFGLVLLCQLLYGVATFRTVPEEAELLQKVGGPAGLLVCDCARGLGCIPDPAGAGQRRAAVRLAGWLAAERLGPRRGPTTSAAMGGMPLEPHARLGCHEPPARRVKAPTCLHSLRLQDIARAKAELASKGIKY